MEILFLLGLWPSWILTTLLNPAGIIDLIAGNPLDFFDTMVELLGTESGTVLAWAHFVAGDIIATRWMWRKAMENNIGLNKTRTIVFLESFLCQWVCYCM